MSAEAVLVVGVGAVLVVAFVVIAYRRRWAWTGFTTSSDAMGRKTLWDWLPLLIIPAVLVGARPPCEASHQRHVLVSTVPGVN